MAIRDHFRDKVQHAAYSVGRKNCSVTASDDWTLEFMSVPYFQRLKEAFDEDGSGYVTIGGVNNFVGAQPSELGWRYVPKQQKSVAETLC